MLWRIGQWRASGLLALHANKCVKINSTSSSTRHYWNCTAWTLQVMFYFFLHSQLVLFIQVVHMLPVLFWNKEVMQIGTNVLTKFEMHTTSSYLAVLSCGVLRSCKSVSYIVGSLWTKYVKTQKWNSLVNVVMVSILSKCLHMSIFIQYTQIK